MAETADRARPLQGVRVLDLTRVLSGPYCTALLADLGAEVIKIEGERGDDYRHIGPFIDDESVLFAALNRGKSSIVLDLKSAFGADAVRRLAEEVDVLVENFRPGVMDRLGLGWEALSEINPRLIYVAISGFGRSGPNSGQPAYDLIVQALSGIMDATGDPDGSPTMIGEPIGDVAAGLFAAWGISTALFDRERSGRGRLVDVAMFDSLLAMMPTLSARHLAAGEAPRRVGNRHPLSAPFGVYAARDGHFAVAVLNEALFSRFATALGRPDIVDDPRFASDSLRRANEPALADIIEGWAGERSAGEAVVTLTDAGLPAATIRSVSEAWQSEQARARQLWGDSDDGRGVRLPQQPVHFSGAPRSGLRPAPRLGADGARVLAGIGMERANDN